MTRCYYCKKLLNKRRCAGSFSLHPIKKFFSKKYFCDEHCYNTSVKLQWEINDDRT